MAEEILLNRLTRIFAVGRPGWSDSKGRGSLTELSKILAKNCPAQAHNKIQKRELVKQKTPRSPFKVLSGRKSLSVPCHVQAKKNIISFEQYEFIPHLAGCLLFCKESAESSIKFGHPAEMISTYWALGILIDPYSDSSRHEECTLASFCL